MLLDFYAENGPTGLARYLLRNLPDLGYQYGIEGFLTMLVGNRVPYRHPHVASDAEREIWNRHRAGYRAIAKNALDVKGALGYVKNPGWSWKAGN